MRRTSRPTRSAGHSARGNGFGSRCCSTRASGAVMPCVLVASMSAMMWPRSGHKRRRHRGCIFGFCHRCLKHLRAGPTANLHYICGANGKPMTKEIIRECVLLRRAARPALEIGPRAAQGRRRRTQANNGATVAQLNAMFGWTGAKMACALHAERRPRAAGARCDRQAREQFCERLYTHLNKRCSVRTPKNQNRNKQLIFLVVGGNGLEPPTSCV